MRVRQRQVGEGVLLAYITKIWERPGIRLGLKEKQN